MEEHRNAEEHREHREHMSTGNTEHRECRSSYEPALAHAQL